MSIPPSIKVGDTFSLNAGGSVVVMRYDSVKSIHVKFPAGNTAIVNSSNLKKGTIKDPMNPSVYGKGFIGCGEHEAIIKRRKTRAYNAWIGMLKRCYCSRYQAKKPTYVGCQVSEEWLNFQNFCDWFKSQRLAEEDGSQVDKDLICPGNKIYGPEHCALIPGSVNSLLNGCGEPRGDYPIGVTWSKSNKKFVALCSIDGKQKHLGYFSCPAEAHEEYRKEKEANVRRVAEAMKEKIGDRVYSALMKYRVSCPIYDRIKQAKAR